MSGDEIIKEIRRYVNDNVYNYAVLIDGEWGSGKTYFVKNILKEKIEAENRRVKYISLYGCKSIEDIRENLIWEFSEELSKIISDKVPLLNRIHRKKGGKSEKSKKGEEIKEATASTTKKILATALKNKWPGLPAYELAWDWLQLASFVLIFDDIERCE